MRLQLRLPDDQLGNTIRPNSIAGTCGRLVARGTVRYGGAHLRIARSSHEALLLPGSLVQADLLVAGARRASRSDAEADLDADSAAWTMKRLRERLYRSLSWQL